MKTIPGISAVLLSVALFCTSAVSCGRSPSATDTPGSSGLSSSSSVSAASLSDSLSSAAASSSLSDESSDGSGGGYHFSCRDYNGIRSGKPGELLDTDVDRELFVKLLLTEEYTLPGLTASLGAGYRKVALGTDTKYDYGGGLYFSADDSGSVYEIGWGDLEAIAPISIRKKTCDLFNDPGDEILILYQNQKDYHYSSELLAISASNGRVVRHFALDYLTVSDFRTGDFLGDGTRQLYLREENREGYALSNIYAVRDGDLFRALYTDSFSAYADGIGAGIAGHSLSLDIGIGDHTRQYLSVLPEKLFYNGTLWGGAAYDPNSLLSVRPEWTPVQSDGRERIRLRLSVELADHIPDGITDIFFDLARVDMVLGMHGGVPSIEEIGSAVKYGSSTDEPAIPVLKADEAGLRDGPVLGMGMQDAYRMLKGNMDGYGTDYEASFGGVTLYGCSNMDTGGTQMVVCQIVVKDPGFATVRGLRVGDPAAKAESLYGKPDIGFSGDASATYCFADDAGGILRVSRFDTMTIHYRDGIIESIEMVKFYGDI